MRAAALLVLFGLGAAACGDAEIVVPGSLSLVAVFPSHGATGISPDVQPLVYFSDALAEPSQLETAIHLDCLGTVSCSQPNVAGCPAVGNDDVTYDPGAGVARLTPPAPLQAVTCYVLVVEAGIRSSADQVAPLPRTVRASFLTR